MSIHNHKEVDQKQAQLLKEHFHNFNPLGRAQHQFCAISTKVLLRP